MTIGTNDLAQKWGTPVTVCSLAATLANAANTFAGLTNFTQTQLDNSTVGAPFAKLVFGCPDTFAAAPNAGSTIDVYMTEDDIDGTSDETPEPASADIVNLGRYVTSFVIDNQDVANIKPKIISMLGVQKCRFNFYNGTGQTLSFSTLPITIKATLFTLGPTP